MALKRPLASILSTKTSQLSFFAHHEHDVVCAPSSYSSIRSPSLKLLDISANSATRRQFHASSRTCERHSQSRSSTTTTTNNQKHQRKVAARKVKPSPSKYQEFYDEWKRQEYLCHSKFSEYQGFWKSHDETESSSSSLSKNDKDGKTSVASSHPWTDWSHPTFADATWEQLVQSEKAFMELCQSYSDVSIALSAMPVMYIEEHDNSTAKRHGKKQEREDDDDNNDTMAHNSYFLTLPWRSVSYPSHHVPMDQEILDQMQDCLALWEQMLQERTALIEALQPADYLPEVPRPSSTTNFNSEPVSSTSKTQNFIGKWFQSFLIGDDDGETRAAHSSIPSPAVLRAHESKACQPNQKHHSRILGRFFFHFPRGKMEDEEAWFQERASRIQEILDLSPSTRDTFCKKSLRLYVRAMGEVGTFQACRRAEQVIHHRFRNMESHLQRFILFNYWQITNHARQLADASTDVHDGKTAPFEDAYLATRRVIDVLMGAQYPRHLRFTMNMFGFHSLANTAGHVEPDKMPRYFQLVDRLTRRTFGNVNAARLLKTSSFDPSSHSRDYTSFLSPHDATTLHLLVQIYGRQAATGSEYHGIAERLMDILFHRYSLLELQNVIARSTFDLLLQDAQFRVGWKTLNWMVQDQSWWPTEESWRRLFSMTKLREPEIDLLWRKYRLCGAIRGGDYGLSPREATKAVLKAQILQNGATRDKASTKVTQSLQWLHDYSTPFFFSDRPHLVKHLYGVEDKPDRDVYAAVFQISNQVADWELATSTYSMAKEQKRLGGLIFYKETYVDFLKALVHCPDANQRNNYAREIFEEALEYDQVDRVLLEVLEEYFNDFYQEHIKDSNAINA